MRSILSGGKGGRLGSSCRRIPSNTGGGLDDGEVDRVGEFDRDDFLIDEERLDAIHVLGHERDEVCEVVGGERELIEVGGVHEVEKLGLTVEELDRSPFETRLAQCISATVRLIEANLRLEVSRLDLVEGGGTSGRGRLYADMFDDVRRAIDLDDHPLLEILGGNHGVFTSRPTSLNSFPALCPAQNTMAHVG